jgi:hypothetical protein
LLFFVLNISFPSNTFTLNGMIPLLTNIYVFRLDKDLYSDKIASLYFLVSGPNNISSIISGSFLTLVPTWNAIRYSSTNFSELWLMK